MTKNSSSSFGSQHVELAKLRHAQVVGDLEGDEGMLFQEEHRVVLFADPLDGLEDDVDQHCRQTRQGPVGKSRLGFPFCISLASVEGPCWLVPQSRQATQVPSAATILSGNASTTRSRETAFRSLPRIGSQVRIQDSRQPSEWPTRMMSSFLRAACFFNTRARSCSTL